MRSTATATLLALALALPSSLAAQEPSKTHYFYIGKGFELIPIPFEWLGGTNRWQLQAGYARQVRRLGFRLGVAYYAQHSGGDYFENRQSVGATFDLTYDLTRGRVRPYLLGGWGLFRRSGSYSLPGSGPQHYDDLAAALIYGAGLRLSLRKTEVFAEGRVQSPAHMPLTLGVRF